MRGRHQHTPAVRGGGSSDHADGRLPRCAQCGRTAESPDVQVSYGVGACHVFCRACQHTTFVQQPREARWWMSVEDVMHELRFPSTHATRQWLTRHDVTRIRRGSRRMLVARRDLEATLLTLQRAAHAASRTPSGR